MYNEYQYWNTRLHPTSQDGEYTQAHLDYIGKHIQGAKRVLDFGPGIGRTFSAYKGIAYVEGYDISSIYRDKALLKAQELGINYISTLNTSHNTTCIPYDNKWFNAVVACEVLLHQRPEKIVKIMEELIRIAEKVVVITWQDSDGEVLSAEHCFNHNYQSICASNCWQIDDWQTFKEQVFFTYAKQ